MKKLSIIGPYYNCWEYAERLIEKMLLQIKEKEEVEFIIVDDGCNETRLDKYVINQNIKIYHLNKNSGGASKPRNVGLDNAQGEYIVFVDMDDLISNDYIEKILEKTNTSEFDYCLFSWKFNGQRNEEVIITEEAPSWNCSVWNCIYKRETIGNERFNTSMKIAEDYDFNIRTRKGKRENITDILYLYTDNRKGSLTDVK